LEFMARDIAFAHGEGALKRILVRALNFNPRFLTPAYVAAAAHQDPQGFLNRIRKARADYVDIVQRPAANLRQGVLNRVAQAHDISKQPLIQSLPGFPLLYFFGHKIDRSVYDPVAFLCQPF
jgi:hypothetical protein